MTTHPTKLSSVHTAASLAQRRDALLAECALQRLALGVQTWQLLEPLTGGNLRHTLATRFRIPLMLGGAVLGLALVRPRRVLPLLRASGALLKHATTAMPIALALARRFSKQETPP
ncbi:hypothetical protein [Janthinobacterium violaceinigrum]|uniref:YqjK-like protein n=1 Tax=Janthinobacterium violaceinigrum TaxID=2654252 RepID=A0A6I1HR05_9BURK|nr:hypothetical protein [Janthinobacterium violaceinigrum]KAB8058916.1 hypothetical protein GCN75_27125 [Janthinobacterium violaceinigrum]